MFDERRDAPLAHVRQRSRSVWLHFPHVELLFLLLAYEGATTAQASMLNSECKELVVMASILLVLFPVLLLLLAWRVVHALQAGAIDYVDDEEEDESLHDDGSKKCIPRSPFCCVCNSVSALWGAIRRGWQNGDSIFEAYDKGMSVSVCMCFISVAASFTVHLISSMKCSPDSTVWCVHKASCSNVFPLFVLIELITGHWEVPHHVTEDNERLSREAFAVGFEPIYSDFRGAKHSIFGVDMFAAYYIIIVMLRFIATGVISAVLGDDGTVATTALCIVYAVNIVIVVLWRPFSNSFLFLAETALLAINLFSLVLVRLGAGNDNDTTTNDLLYGGYLLLQLFGIFILTIPVYIDLVLSIVGKINHKLFKSKDDGDDDWNNNGISDNNGVSEAELKSAKISLGDFLHFWQVMMRHNAAAVLTSLAHKFKRDPQQQQHKRANSKRERAVTKVSSSLFRGSSVQSEMVDYRSDSSRDNMANAQYYLNEAFNHQQPVEHGPRRKSVNNLSTSNVPDVNETSPDARPRKHTSSKALLDENGNAVRQRKNSMTTVHL
jgi:hypothetical protein